MSSPVRVLLDEQIAYYRARAREYDETSHPTDDRHAPHAAAAREALRAFSPRGRILEIGAGTGQYTAILAGFADELTAVDSSAEMLDLNAAKTSDPRVRYHAVDAFELEPNRGHDVVFFGFFLSHVPAEQFDVFWNVVKQQLAPDGRVFFIDEGRHFGWREDWIDEEAGIVRRTLRDGSSHRAVKVLWQPDELEARLGELEWTAAVTQAGPFYWGTAMPGDSGDPSTA